jgi:hypothetical protein
MAQSKSTSLFLLLSRIFISSIDFVVINENYALDVPETLQSTSYPHFQYTSTSDSILPASRSQKQSFVSEYRNKTSLHVRISPIRTASPASFILLDFTVTVTLVRNVKFVV